VNPVLSHGQRLGLLGQPHFFRYNENKGVTYPNCIPQVEFQTEAAVWSETKDEAEDNIRRRQSAIEGKTEEKGEKAVEEFAPEFFSRLTPAEKERWEEEDEQENEQSMATQKSQLAEVKKALDDLDKFENNPPPDFVNRCIVS
jgi:hypothetical protein